MRTQRVIALAISFLIIACLAISIITWKKKKMESISLPTNGIIFSYHDGGYEVADIQDLDQKTGLVLVITKDSKISITFKPTADNFHKFHIGWIAPVTFQCSKIKEGKCDFDSPYKLFVGNGLVEVKQLKFAFK